MRIKKAVLCKGPKSRNCSQIDEKNVNMKFKMVFPNDLEFKKAKMALYMADNTNRAPDIVKITNNLCQHFFFAPFLHATLEIYLKTCVVCKKKVPSNITGITLFKGPKRLDCGVAKLEHKAGDFHNLTLRFGFNKPITVQKFQIVMWLEKNGSVDHAPDLVRRIDNPCNHFFFKALLKQMFDVSSSCRANKGAYTFRVDLRTLFYDFFGYQYPCGNYQVNTCLLDRNCNVICIRVSFNLIQNCNVNIKNSDVIKTNSQEVVGK